MQKGENTLQITIVFNSYFLSKISTYSLLKIICKEEIFTVGKLSIVLYTGKINDFSSYLFFIITFKSLLFMNHILF